MKTKQQSLNRLRSLSREQLDKLSDEFILHESDRFEVITWAIIFAIFGTVIISLFI